jgi:hypothetical protein
VQTPGALERWWQKATHWSDMVMGPEISVCRSGDSHPEMSGCGLYMLFGADEGLEYVGKAQDLAVRMAQHWYAGKYGREPRYALYACMQLPPYAVHDVEVAHIYALEPPRNLLYERVRWKYHEAMVGLIRETWGPKQ